MLDPCLSRPEDLRGRGRPVRQGARILRERQEGLRAAIDRAAGAPSIAAARRLVSVYDGGSMPTQPDHIFLAHPVELDGTEVEAGPTSPDVDTSATIPVVVLGHAPKPGDILVASAVGGRWVAERGGAGRTRICVTACGSLPVFGAVITILSGSRIVATCTTGADGCCQPPVSGTFIVQVTVGGTLVYGATRTLSPGSTTSISLAGDTGLVCCGGYVIPQVLTLTDSIGTITFLFDPNYYYPLWTGGHAVQRLSCSVTTTNDNCFSNNPTEGPVRVCYWMTCRAGQDPTFQVQRLWSWVFQQGTSTPIWYQDDSGFTPGQLCMTAPPSICGDPLTDIATFEANPSSASPFVLNGTPAPFAGNATSDPIGGSIAISA